MISSKPPKKPNSSAMASGARPSSNQRSESAGKKARGGHHLHEHVDQCVVCGDRACNHHYYGVAACHGCKCFFWRSVKQNQQYVCRYQQQCEINPSYTETLAELVDFSCLFKRCLNAGMQPESVRMQSTKTTIKLETDQQAVKRPSSNYGSVLESNAGPGSSESLHDNNPDSPAYKKVKKENLELVNAITELEERINEVADFSENDRPKRMLSLYEIFAFPEYLECYRTHVSFCVRLHRTTVEEMEFCKFRTLTKSVDFLNGFEAIGLGGIPIEDKIKLLRSAYASLTIFDIVVGTLSATKDENLLCLPTGITVSRNEELAQNSFMSQKLVCNIVNTLTRTVDSIEMTKTEEVLLKAIILMSQEVHDLSPQTTATVMRLRDRLHGTLYQNCAPGLGESPAIRFARLLHILPKLTLLAREMVEHIRMICTFQPEQKAKMSVFFELYGDIFAEEREASSLSKTMCSRYNNNKSAVTPICTT
ncbi:Protein ultraspiracle [Aphelenchoides bicaudatus]|nr:Protein ultraspiracle [Aphelenchoides bicaudatus]